MRRAFLYSLLLIFLVGCSSTTSPPKVALQKEETPTVFLHGYSGNNLTMKTMMERFEKAELSKTEMVINVSSSGELTVKSNLKEGFEKNNPSIRLVFENSRQDQWQQADWLKLALSYLKETYQVEKINLVGYSMGGISSFLFLETYSGDESLPTVDKLIGIGSPFNEFLENQGQSVEDILTNGPRDISDQLFNYQNLLGNIPKDTSFLLIPGQLSESDLSDGTVPLSSGLGVYALLKQNGFKVEQKIITGNKAKHSKLKKDSEVSDLVAKFLWE